MKRGFFFGVMLFQMHTLRNYLFPDILNIVVNVRRICWEITFWMPLSKKITTTVTEVVLIQGPFLTVGSKQK